MLKVLNEIESAMNTAIADYKVSCKRGCSSCCHSLVLITIPEAMALLPYVTPAVRSAVAKWCADYPALATIQPEGINVQYSESLGENYWRGGIPCVFLTPKGECSVYAVRPGVCRFTFAVSPAEHCAPGREQEVIDPDAAHALRFEASDRIAREHGWPTNAYPLPAALRFCFDTQEGIAVQGPE